jgi:carbamoyl-phosphate synthase large subunit
METAGRLSGRSVLVTGVGAPPGISIFKAVRQSPLQVRVIGTDADPLSAGLFRADAGYVLPAIAADENRYLRRLEELCLRERVALVCFGSEIEMRHVAPHLDALERRTGARLVLNRPETLELLMDKWTMAVALREKGLPVPDTVLAQDGAGVEAFLSRHGFPVILKPRHGSGSKNLFLVKDAGELEFLTRYVPEPVLQEYLLPEDEEYTVGVYKSARAGYVGQIVLRRSLAAGLTYKAEVVFDDEIEAACRRLVEAFDVWGPVNVQLRKTTAGVRIFEVNLRFSSSAVMRAHFGFNEPELCLRDVVLGEALAAPRITTGRALRYWDELYVTSHEHAELVERGYGEGRRGRKQDVF